MEEYKYPILLFDGLCGFCNKSVLTLISMDRKAKIKFASLQSNTGKRLSAQYNIPDKLDSVVFIANGRAHQKSDAILYCFNIMGLPWSIIGRTGKLLPRAWRDGIYDFVARNRYRIMGTKEACSLPSASVRQRFISD